MGLYLSTFFITNNEKDKDNIKNKDIENSKISKKETRIKIKLNKTFVNDIPIKEIAEFPCGNIIAITEENIEIFDKNFSLLSQIKKKTDNIYIKEDKIFVTYDKNRINIWLIEYENNKIQIKLSSEIIHDNNNINKIIIIDNYDIIGADNNNIFTYKKINDNIPYIYSLANKLSKLSWEKFLITKDNKFLIIYRYKKIEIYQIKKMKLICFYEPGILLYSSAKEIYSFDDFTFAIQFSHDPMTICEPPDILAIYNFQDCKLISLIGIIPLETYNIGILTKENKFITINKDYRTISIYTYQNLLNIVKKMIGEQYYEIRRKIKNMEDCKPNIIELEKRYLLCSFRSKLYVFNDNKIIVKNFEGNLDIYKVD